MARMYTRIEANDKILGEMLQELEDDGLAPVEMGRQGNAHTRARVF